MNTHKIRISKLKPIELSNSYMNKDNPVWISTRAFSNETEAKKYYQNVILKNFQRLCYTKAFGTWCIVLDYEIVFMNHPTHNGWTSKETPKLDLSWLEEVEWE
jgi:hypothetical protein